FPIYALVFANIIDAFSTRGSQLENEAKKWCVFFVILACGYFIFTFLQNGLFGLASEYLTERLRKSMFRAILNQEIGYFDDDRNSTGSLTSNLSTDAQRVQGVSGVTLGAILQILTTLVASLIVSFYFGWKLAAVATAALPFLILSNKFRMDIFTYFSEKSKENYQKSAQVACEAVASIRTVQSLTREKAVFEAYSAYLQEPLRNGYKSALLNTPLYALATAFSFMINFIVFLYGGRLMAYEGYTTKTFFTVFVAIIFGANGIGRIFAYAPDLNKAKNAGQAILKLLNRKPMIDSASLASGEKITQLEGHVRFADVKFTYPHRPEVKVLRGLNIEVKPGQFAALVGPSGCGKSTSIGLLERFYNVSGGEILIDKKNLSLYNVTEYRKQIGLVSQEPNLFDLSIKENICFGLDYIPSQEEIERVCKEANIHDFIISQPDKYDTKVGPKGGQMSGGQKQRISIARALIRNPKILLLDEATSALDAESEKLVQEALDKASKGRTTIAIAHRLSSIQHADIIFVLKDGVVVEKGTHYELYQKGGVYHELAVQQNLNIV
ncbi:GTPase-activating protein, partial [Globomyces sp. JEL0801]